MARLSGGVGEMEESSVHYTPKKKRKLEYINVILFLSAVYVALFVDSLAKYVLLMVLFAIYFFARLD